MKKPASPSLLVPARRRFITTRWSLVLAAGDDTAPEARQALAELYKLYLPPLYIFLRRQGHPPEEAKELMQGFFTRLMDKKDLADADPSRGRFRTWLIAALRNYAANQWVHDQAQKRGGGQVLIELDEAERLFRQEPASGLTPERAFERRWALALLEHVLKTLREEYVKRGRGALFDKLKATLTGEEEDSYRRIGEELGMTESAVKVDAHRFRRRYQELLREEISHTVQDSKDVDDELRQLLSALKAE